MGDERSHSIHPFIWPDPQLSGEQRLYFDASGAIQTPDGLCLSSGASVEFGQYNNIFPASFWLEQTPLTDLSLDFTFHGQLRVTIRAIHSQRSWDIVASGLLASSQTRTLEIDLNRVPQGCSALSVTIEAVEKTTISSIAFTTLTAPVRHPDLAICITTYKREKAVDQLIRRLKTKPYPVFILDNGQTLRRPKCDIISIHSSPNLGGAGGFSYGLMLARAAGASHVVFCDDDASFHPEALDRIHAALSYCDSPNTAISGAMLSGIRKFELWENSATFRYGCRPSHHGLDLRAHHASAPLLTPVHPEDRYGGWWLFAFPVQATKHLPPPMFLRGDDISFSLKNPFNIITLPGVAAWQDDFPIKDTPLTAFFDMRSHLLHPLASDAPASRWRLVKMAAWLVAKNLVRFRYEAAQASLVALRSVLRGELARGDDPSLSARRHEVNQLWALERPHPKRPTPTVAPQREPNLLDRISLNGHFGRAPRAPHRTLVFNDHRKIWGASGLTQLHPDGHVLWQTRRSTFRALAILVQLAVLLLRLAVKLRSIERDICSNYPRLTSEAYWRKHLPDPIPPRSHMFSHGPAEQSPKRRSDQHGADGDPGV